MTNIQEIIDRIQMLDPLPSVATRILSLAERPDRSLSEIADLIAYEPSITANLLKFCNSAYLGLSRKVDSIHDAIPLLGLDHLVELVLVQSASVHLKTAQDGYGPAEGDLWRHAAYGAHVAQILAQKYKLLDNQHRVFTAALLKDIGKQILGRYSGFASEQINRLVQAQGYSFDEAEKRTIGMDHAELGAFIVEKWRFSDKMISIIRNHHLSDAAARDDLETVIVYLSDMICTLMGLGAGSDGMADRCSGEVLKRLNLTARDLHTIIAESTAQQRRIENLLEWASHSGRRCCG
ncbi:MAG: HDOD domain-containing protein [Desulfobacterales bacterium]|nr:MAG: HDOD domain-containing protein [Desulfobacterales bacterium]